MTITFEGTQALRVVLLAATAVVLAMYLWRTVRVWSRTSPAQRLIFVGLLMLLITTAWDTVLLVIDDAGFSLRVLPYLIGLGCLYAYFTEPRRRYEERLGMPDPYGPKPARKRT